MKVIILLDGHRAYCSVPLLLQTAAEYNVTIIHVSDDHIRNLQHMCKCFLGLSRII